MAGSDLINFQCLMIFLCGSSLKHGQSSFTFSSPQFVVEVIIIIISTIIIMIIIKIMIIMIIIKIMLTCLILPSQLLLSPASMPESLSLLALIPRPPFRTWICNRHYPETVKSSFPSLSWWFVSSSLITLSPSPLTTFASLKPVRIDSVVCASPPL